MGLKHGAAFRQGIPRKGQTDCLDHIAPSGMNEHGSRPRAALLLKEGGDRCRGHVRHRTVEEITQLAAAGLEPEHVAFFRPMERAESVTSQAGRTRPAAPNRGGCTVAEQACAHQHAVVIVEIKRRGADLHRHARHHSLWLRSHQVTGGAQGWDGRSATQADQIVQDRVAAQAELLRHIAGDAGTQIAGAGAQESASSWSGRSSAWASAWLNAAPARRGASRRYPAFSSSGERSNVWVMSSRAKWRVAIPLSPFRIARRMSCERRFRRCNAAELRLISSIAAA